MKRKTTFLMASVLAASCFNVTGYAANFHDIDQVPWSGAKTYINGVADKGLMVGDIDPSNGKARFRPKDRVTYCEATQLAYTVLKKSEKLQAASNLTTKWSQVLKSYSIPDWAKECVAYALENNVISLTDVSRYMSRKGNHVSNNYASRESVAVIFGKMLSKLYTVNTGATLTYSDKGSVASSSIPYVDLLSRLGILVGDSDNNFTPKAYINRSEMAVLTSKTYDVVNDKTDSSTNSSTVLPSTNETIKGVVASIEQYGGNKLLAVTGENGQKQGFLVNSTTYVLLGETAQQINVSNLNVGDEISVEYNGGQVKVIRVYSEIQTEQTVEGLVEDVDNIRIYVEKSTGKTESFYFTNSCDFEVDNKSVSMKEFIEKYRENNLDVKLTLDLSGNVTKADATARAEEGYVGKLVSIDDYELNYKSGNNSKTKSYCWVSDPIILLEGDNATIRKINDAKNDDTLYVKFYLDAKDRIKKLLVSEDKFSSYKDSNSEVTGTMTHLYDDEVKLRRLSNSDTERYDFDNDIDYYLDGEESSYRKVNAAFDDAEEDDDDFYVRVQLNSDDEVTKLYASTRKSSLDEDSYDTTKDGAIIFVNSNNLKLDPDRGSREVYEMSDDVDYELDDKSSSLHDIQEAVDDAAADGDDLYATIYLDDDDEVVRIKASKDRDSSERKITGDIKSMSSSEIEIRGKDEYDIDSDADVELDDEDMDIDDLEEAVEDKDRDFKATITVEDGEVTDIDAYTTYASGELKELTYSRRKITIETRDKTIEYKLDGTNPKCTGTYETVRELQIAFYDDAEDFDVNLTFNDEGEVTEIYARKQ